MSNFRRLVLELSSEEPSSKPIQSMLRYVVDEVALGQISLGAVLF
jgi:hypothetical protein